MELGSKFVYLGNEEEDFEEVQISERNNCALSDSDCSDDDGETCMLDILDTAGQEEYSSLRDQYVRDGQGFVIIYSITDRQSLLEAETILAWVKRVKGSGDPSAILVANKQDLVGTDGVQVSSQDGQDLATKLAVPFYETSAKTGAGVEEAIKGLVKVIPRTSTDYKIVMLGSGAVGKSSITLRFVSNSFVDDYDPTIEDSFRKMISVAGLKAMSKDEKKARKKSLKKKHKAQNVQHQYAQGPPPPCSIQRAVPRTKSKSGGGILGGMISSLKNVVLPRSQRRAQTQQQRHRSLSSDDDEEMEEGGDEVSSAPVRRVQERKTDGNVILIAMRQLLEEPTLVTGDPIKCKKCRAVLTSTGVLQDEGENKTWTCEFCGEANRNLNISEDEVPKGDSFDYMLAPPTKPKEAEQEKEGEAVVETKTTPGIMVYCMDISSSMSGLCHVPESHAAWREERTRGEESISSVTRLQCIQKAIERLAEQLKLEQPEKQVLLTVFSSDMAVKGGGRTDNLPDFTGLDRATFDSLLEMGINLSNDYPLTTIDQSHEAIDAAVKALYTTGCTALGPALSICTGFVSKVPSSEIILCTDGEPNVGVGSLNRGGRSGDEFYEMIGNYARSKNVTISVLAMEGASTGLQHVSKAAENSGGTTTKLNPVEIVRQLRLIAQNEVVAFSVTVRFYLHPSFVFDEPEFPGNLSVLEKEVGCAKKETDLTFRFKLKEGIQAKDITSVPFQVQIEYTRPDGMQGLRVLSKRNEATNSRKNMEEGINVSVVGVSAMKTTAKMAQAGQANKAQHLVKNFKRMVDRGAKDSKQREERLAFKTEISTWDDHLTDNNLRLEQGQLMDVDADMYQGALNMNAVQQCSAASAPKMGAVQKRKMNVKSKAAYYSYKDKF